ncbi:Zn-dependent protease [candidate division WOR-3 bacterium JGI_Cruoil_03_44_89]|uniref:Zn-dependent protease n=1 Tax=candidate division WOR-3 bacterium JGI_Cruoil_03_44_89 TaxID=1973748 RepID=A0A235BNE7_UNCW3|nr:MAG: Zn-dependent protease [candidate division WOR-3 bacterium JGI_Cruoil_03_44_89]
MFDILEFVLSKSPGYTEVRYHKREITEIIARKGNLEEATTSLYNGVGIRVLLDGSWGFSSTSKVNKRSLEYVLGEAVTAARLSAPRRTRKVKRLAVQEPAVGDFSFEINDPVTNHSFKEKLNLVLNIEKRARNSSSLITSASSGYCEIIDEKYILTSSGTKAHILDAKPEFRLTCVARKGGILTSATQAVGVTGGWGDLFGKKSAFELCDRASKLAVDLLSAPYPEGKKATVILDPDLVGTLAHEAIGHTCEADFVLSGSVANGKLNTQVASPLVTLVDSGDSPHKPSASGMVCVDDEGSPARKVVIIENGILKSYLHNLESSAIFGVEPTGNARAWEYDSEPIIRMRNTYIEPGDKTLEELIDGVRDGFLLKGLEGGGQADANAEFMFGVREAYRIKNGKLGKLMRGVSISGQAFEVLKSVDAVGKDFSWGLGAGHCGKGQPAKVDGGGPYLRCEVTIGGRRI